MGAEILRFPHMHANNVERLQRENQALMRATVLLAQCLHDCAEGMEREDCARALVVLGQARRLMEGAA